jgi:uncharacterized protein YndB with AHSA1/START domain
MMIRNMALAIIFCAIGIVFAAAEVADSSASGFTVKNSLSINAAPDEVYRRLLHVGEWWNSEHTYSGDSHNLSIEAKAGGCFCEKLPNGGSVQHMEVLLAMPGRTLRMGGGLGPLQGIGAVGSLTIQFSQVGAGTKLTMTYAVAGYLPAGMNTWAVPVDSVLTGQFVRLKNYVERGDPAKNEAEKQK